MEKFCYIYNINKYAPVALYDPRHIKNIEDDTDDPLPSQDYIIFLIKNLSSALEGNNNALATKFANLLIDTCSCYPSIPIWLEEIFIQFPISIILIRNIEKIDSTSLVSILELISIIITNHKIAINETETGIVDLALKIALSHTSDTPIFLSTLNFLKAISYDQSILCNLPLKDIVSFSNSVIDILDYAKQIYLLEIMVNVSKATKNDDAYNYITVFLDHISRILFENSIRDISFLQIEILSIQILLNISVSKAYRKDIVNSRLLIYLLHNITFLNEYCLPMALRILWCCINEDIPKDQIDKIIANINIPFLIKLMKGTHKKVRIAAAILVNCLITISDSVIDILFSEHFYDLSFLVSENNDYCLQLEIVLIIIKCFESSGPIDTKMQWLSICFMDIFINCIECENGGKYSEVFRSFIQNLISIDSEEIYMEYYETLEDLHIL